MGCVLILISIELYHGSVVQDKELQEEISELEVEERPTQKVRFHLRALRWLVGSDVLDWLKMSKHRWLTPVETLLVGTILFVALYLMLCASREFLQHDRPFIVGSVIYLCFGVPAFMLWAYFLWMELKIGVQEGVELKLQHLKEKQERAAERVGMV